MRIFKTITTESILDIKRASVILGKRVVLNDIDMYVRAGETVALLGHNGAGKSTLLRCIMGILPLEHGAIRLGFTQWRGSPSYLVRSGVCYLPQNEKLFPHMTIEENLRVFSEALQIGNSEFKAQYRRLTEQFPILQEGRSAQAGRLSGGEAQQVALARSLLGAPKLLLLDEPSIGLGSTVRGKAFEAIRSAADRMGTAIVLVEHRVREALQICQRAYILRQGAIVASCDADNLLRQPDRLRDLII